MMVSKTGYMPSFPATGLAVDKHAAQCSWHLGRITSVIRPSCLKTRQKTCEAGGRVYAAIGNARSQRSGLRLSAATRANTIGYVTAAVSVSAEEDLAARFIGPRGKVTRSAVNKLKLAELQDACLQLELSALGKKPELVDRIYNRLVSTDTGSEAHDEESSATRPKEGLQQPQDRLDGSIPEPSRVASASAATRETPGVSQHTPQSLGADQESTRGKTSATPDVSATQGASRKGHVAEESKEEAASDLSVTWLGSSSGAPTRQRNVSCIALDMGKSGVLLVDCGEGSKRQLARSQIDMLQIRHICVTHMHGDHCFGIPGLLTALSYAKAGDPEQEQTPLYIYGPPGVFEWVHDTLQVTAAELRMRVLVVEFHKSPAHAHKPTPMDPHKKLWLSKVAPDPESMPFAADTIQRNQEAGGKSHKAEEKRQKSGVVNGLSWTIPIDSAFRVAVAQLMHRVPCLGYCIQEARAPVPVDTEILRKNKIIGDPAEYEGVVPGRKVLLLGDTCDSTSIAHHAMNADLISHEATFSDGMEHKAGIAGHSTSRMAGEFARSIKAFKLFLTHFSPRFQSNNSETTTQLAGKAGGKPEAQLPGGLEDGAAEDVDASDIDAIVAQAADGFRSSEVYAVKDFMTIHVAKHEAMVRKRRIP